MNICDKCGELVPPYNDAALLDTYLGSVVSIFAQSRHLLPVGECEGSPSRAQYIEGQPKDHRGVYGYNNLREISVRAAHYDLLRLNFDTTHAHATQ